MIHYNTHMKIAILGAGFSGLTAGYELAKAGYQVEIFEKAAQVAGAAGGFKRPGWDWYLDYTYHHCFTNEHEILDLAKEIGFANFLKMRPETASLYLNKQQPDNNDNPLFQYLFGQHTKSYKLDSAHDLLRFERLPLLDRLRTGLVLALLKFGPKLNYYDKTLAKDFLTTTMGRKANQELWEPLFLKKFQHYYHQINLGFFWARLRRTPDLSYPPGGYQALANQLALKTKKLGAKIYLKTEIKNIKLDKKQFILTGPSQQFRANKLINTLQTPLFLKIGGMILPTSYRRRLQKIEYLGAHNIIFASRQKVLPKTYWLSLATPASRQNPGSNYMVAVQQTNFVPAKHYHHQHLLYLATYTNKPKPFALKDKKLAKQYRIIQQAYLKYGQPLYTPEFVKNKPDYLTPVPNLYFANMELTYPYDRGTNQAVRCGQQVAQKMIK